MKTRPAPTATPDEATPAVVPVRRNSLNPKKLLLSKCVGAGVGLSHLPAGV